MKIEIDQEIWMNNKPVPVGTILTAEGDAAIQLLKFGHEVKDNEPISKVPEYETKVILPKVKGKKK